MVLVQKFRVFNEAQKVITPWHKYKAKVRSTDQLVEVRETLGERMFVKPADIDLCFVEATPESINRCINLRGAGYPF